MGEAERTSRKRSDAWEACLSYGISAEELLRISEHEKAGPLDLLVMLSRNEDEVSHG